MGVAAPPLVDWRGRVITTLVLHVVAALITIGLIVAVIRRMRRLK